MTLSIPEAIKLQKELASKVVEYNDFEKINYIAGIDVSNNLRDPENLLYAGIVVFFFSKS